ncbi:MAG: hypothetical protein ACRDIZ_02250 [Actinomycetota bacterium]
MGGSLCRRTGLAILEPLPFLASAERDVLPGQELLKGKAHHRVDSPGPPQVAKKSPGSEGSAWTLGSGKSHGTLMTPVSEDRGQQIAIPGQTGDLSHGLPCPLFA